MVTATQRDTWNGKLHVDHEHGVFVDEWRRDIMLRGVNAGGRSKWAPYLPFEIHPSATLDTVYQRAMRYFERAASWGLNVVRLPFVWEAIEPEQGMYDATYLSRLGVLLDAAYHNGLRVFLDLHQDLYSAALGGDGFPRWTLHTQAQNREIINTRGWFVSYALDDDVLHAFDRFWANEDGIQDAFREMWALVLGRFGTHPAVIGVDMINEPGWGTATDLERWKREVLVPFYHGLIEELRPLAPGLIFFYGEPGVEFNGLGHGSLFLQQDPVAYAPHLYDPTLLVFPKGGMTAPPTRPISNLGAFRRETGVPVLLGEFGYTHGAEDGPLWLDLAMNAIDAHRISATLWEYSEATELWNEEDLNVIGPDGEDRPILDVYARPYLRAVAGVNARFEYDRHTRHMRASWTAKPGWSEVVIPAHMNLSGPATVRTHGAVLESEYDPQRDLFLLRATPGSNIELEIGL